MTSYLRPTLSMIVALLVVFIFLMSTASMGAQARPKPPPVQGDLKAYVNLIEMKTIMPVDSSGSDVQADFYVVISARGTDGRGSVYSQTIKTAEPLKKNDDDYVPRVEKGSDLFVVFDLWDIGVFSYSFTIELWDDDTPSSSDDLCDIGPDPGRDGITVIWNVATGEWGNDDCEGDSSGYGHASGWDDGAVYENGEDTDDCELWFSINKGYTQATGFGGSVIQPDGTPIGYATIKVYAWRYDNDQAGLLGKVLYYEFTTGSSGAYWIAASQQCRYMLYATKNPTLAAGYWEVRRNITMDPLNTMSFNLIIEKNKYQYEGTEFAMFADVDETETSVSYQFQRMNSYTGTAMAYVGGTGTDRSWTNVQGVKDKVYGGRSFVQRDLIVTHGTYWITPSNYASGVASWAVYAETSYVAERDRSDPITRDVAATWPSNFKYEDPDFEPLEEYDFYSNMCTETTYGFGFEGSLGTTVSAGILLEGGLTISQVIKLKMTGTSGQSLEIHILLKNIDPTGTHHSLVCYWEPCAKGVKLIWPFTIWDFSKYGFTLHVYQTDK